MVLVKNVKFGHILIFRKHFTFLAMFLFFAKYTKKMCLTIFWKKTIAFKTIKKRSLKNRRIGIFSKGLVHGFDQKCEIWPFSSPK